MSKKKRRKKNNQSKKVFNKNLLIKEEIEARKEIELERGQAKERYLARKAEKKLKKKLKLKNKKKNNKRKSEGLINLGFSPEIKEAFINRAASFKKWKDIIWSKLIDQKNLKRDIVIIFLVIIGVLVLLSVMSNRSDSQENESVNNEEFLEEVLPTEEEVVSSLEEEKTQEIAAVQAKIDTEKWKDYKSN